MKSGDIFNIEQRILSLGVISDDNKHPLMQRLDLIKKYHSVDNKVLSFVNANYLQLLFEDLDLINKADKDLFLYYRKLLTQKSLPLDSYFGIRFEIRTAASLFFKNVIIKKTETPDFIIESLSLGIECSSVHLDLNKEKTPKDVTYKVESVISNKTKKNYLLKDLILFVDITNLIYQEGRDPVFSILADKDKPKSNIVNKLNNSCFSSLLYFTSSWEIMEKPNDPLSVTLHSCFWRLDSKNINNQVKNFLDKYYPRGDFLLESNTGKLV